MAQWNVSSIVVNSEDVWRNGCEILQEWNHSSIQNSIQMNAEVVFEKQQMVFTWVQPGKW